MAKWLSRVWAWVCSWLYRPAPRPEKPKFDNAAQELIWRCSEHRKNDWLSRDNWHRLSAEEHQAMLEQQIKPLEEIPAGVYFGNTFSACRKSQIENDAAKKHQRLQLTLRVQK